MKALSLAVVVHVSNLDAAMEYYTNVLGFSTDFVFGDYAGMIFNDVLIHLNGPTNQGTKKVPGSAHFCIDCDGIDQYYQQIVSKGAIIEAPLADRPYGMRDCAINDPDGNTIVFGMALE
ncbi:VOC family protein [Mucilaginibacter mali]|uniref:VOC family protein n=1 Tax=Mucilaginibacter mali TaxID=2740462 RepID=A0A7D4Q240_9SPHI|nr:glyoxalase superfamily protein [Mucilaginibacter mali]QKJ29367.1 VOC family protein [Mucilaginibacter mali]